VESIYGLNGISTISHITYDDCTCEIKKVNRLSGCPPSDQINNRVANISSVLEPSRDGADIVHVVSQDHQEDGESTKLVDGFQAFQETHKNIF